MIAWKNGLLPREGPWLSPEWYHPRRRLSRGLSPRFRGNSDLQALTPSMALITTLPKGRDYLVLYVPRRRRRPSARPGSWMDGKGKTRAAFNQRIWIKAVDPGAAVVLHAIPSNTGYFFAKEEDRAYRGLIEISPDPGKGFQVNQPVQLRNSLAGVLPRRMPSHWPLEALKTQAIVARTYVPFQNRAS